MIRKAKSGLLCLVSVFGLAMAGCGQGTADRSESLPAAAISSKEGHSDYYPGSDATGVVDKLQFYNHRNSDGSEYCAISAASKSIEGEVVIPQYYNGAPGTCIGSSAFCGCASLTSVEIPDSVTSKGDFAFGRCSALTTINYMGTME